MQQDSDISNKPKDEENITLQSTLESNLLQQDSLLGSQIQEDGSDPSKRRRPDDESPLESLRMFFPQNSPATVSPMNISLGFRAPFGFLPTRDSPTYQSPFPYLASVHDQAMSIVMEDTSINNNNARSTPYLPANRFVLVEEPNQIQRKSYKNENRCLLPNPITICPRELKFGMVDKSDDKVKKIVEGTVTVKLVDRDGNNLPEEKSHILESIEGGLIQLLDDTGSANFSLKVLHTSDGDWWRLVFLISYREEGGSAFIREKVFSRQFLVNSNKKKHANGPPLVVALKPSAGPSATENEVWIKGKLFSDRTCVYFDELPAKVVEIAENLLTVIAPARPELTQSTNVTVTVFNIFPKESHPADKKLEYTYVPRTD